MKRIKLQNTDLEVTRACMGTMTFGAQADRREAQRMVHRCLEAGINFFDTANAYSQGEAERILGGALGARRADVVLASKAWGEMGDPVEYRGLSRAALTRALDDSLRRLGTDYLDIYYLHRPDYDTPIEESLETVESMRQAGKIRHAATSNYSAWQICEMHWLCEKQGYAKPCIAQPMYNLLARGIEQEYLACTDRLGISNVYYNPLAGGLLTGKHHAAEAPAPGTRFDVQRNYMNRYWHEATFDAVCQLTAIASAAGMRTAELALTWLLSRRETDCLILGASQDVQLEENLKAIEQPPPPSDALAACDAIWDALKGPVPVYNR